MNTKRLELLKELYAQQPKDAFAPYGIGLEYAGAEVWESASVWFEKAFETQADYLPNYYQWALSLLKTDKSEQAIDVLNKGILLAKTLNENKTLLELEFLLDDLE